MIRRLFARVILWAIEEELRRREATIVIQSVEVTRATLGSAVDQGMRHALRRSPQHSMTLEVVRRELEKPNGTTGARY